MIHNTNQLIHCQHSGEGAHHTALNINFYMHVMSLPS